MAETIDWAGKTNRDSGGVLSGLRVLDFSTQLPGPMASLWLAEAGADVLRIARPGDGDPLATMEPLWEGVGAAYRMLAHGKRSVVLDLKTDAGQATLAPLLETADILIEQFRPGVMERLGLDWETVHRRNPRLIYCSITGFGQEGPLARVAGHDLDYMAESGLLALSMGSAEQPVLPPALIADIAAGAWPAVMNILAALLQRERTGEGLHLDIAMTDGLFPLAWWALAEGFATGRWPGNGDRLFTGGRPRYRLYEAADGRMIAVGAIEQKFWDRFCALIDLPQDLRDDEADPQATIDAIGDILRTRPSAAWQRLFEEEDCCCTVVATLEEAVSGAHARARGLLSKAIAERSDGTRLAALPLPLCPPLRRR